MSIIIRDETANAAVLTIDNNGDMAFGDGTPISAVTIAGQQIIDSDGQIIHGLNSCSATPVEGRVNVGIGMTATITTIAGRTPLVQLDAEYPAQAYFIDFRTEGDPTSGGTESVEPTEYPQPVHVASPGTGEFTIVNNNEADGYVLDQNGDYYDPTLQDAPVTYRWM